MGQLAAIFNQLGADASFLHQFGLFLAVFVVLRTVFLNKLQFVLEIRENKTTKLERSAERKFQEASVLADEYHGKVRRVRSALLAEAEEERARAVAEQKRRLAEAESEVERRVREEGERLRGEAGALREGLLAQAGGFADGLARKLAG